MKILNFFKKIIKKLLGFDNSEFIDNIVCYICGNEALPLPLEPEEELMLIEELANNNQQAKEKLVEHNLRLVVYIAKRFDGCGIDMEDLISVCTGDTRSSRRCHTSSPPQYIRKGDVRREAGQGIRLFRSHMAHSLGSGGESGDYRCKFRC